MAHGAAPTQHQGIILVQVLIGAEADAQPERVSFSAHLDGVDLGEGQAIVARAQAVDPWGQRRIADALPVAVAGGAEVHPVVVGARVGKGRR
jgi:hypothetical protein